MPTEVVLDGVRQLRELPDFAEVKVSPLLLVAKALVTPCVGVWADRVLPATPRTPEPTQLYGRADYRLPGRTSILLRQAFGLVTEQKGTLRMTWQLSSLGNPREYATFLGLPTIVWYSALFRESGKGIWSNSERRASGPRLVVSGRMSGCFPPGCGASRQGAR